VIQESNMSDLKSEMFCSICGEPNEEWRRGFYGHNAQPINDGRCCVERNENVVIPVRLAFATMGERIQ
jgi:hypothetical protein